MALDPNQSPSYTLPEDPLEQLKIRDAIAKALGSQGAASSQPILSPLQVIAETLKGSINGYQASKFLDADKASREQLGNLRGGLFSSAGAPDVGSSGGTAPAGAGGKTAGLNLPPPPDGVSADDDAAIRTIVREAGNQPDMGKAAVAHVIANRLKDGSFGDTPGAIVTAPKQFSPWNPENRGTPADPRMVDPRSPGYQQAAQIWQAVKTGAIPDPTKGALNFANPDLTDSPWVRNMVGSGNYTRIGDHIFGTSPSAGKGVDRRVENDDQAAPRPVQVASADPNFAPDMSRQVPMPAMGAAASKELFGSAAGANLGPLTNGGPPMPPPRPAGAPDDQTASLAPPQAPPRAAAPALNPPPPVASPAAPAPLARPAAPMPPQPAPAPAGLWDQYNRTENPADFVRANAGMAGPVDAKSALVNLFAGGGAPSSSGPAMAYAGARDPKASLVDTLSGGPPATDPARSPSAAPPSGPAPAANPVRAKIANNLAGVAPPPAGANPILAPQNAPAANTAPAGPPPAAVPAQQVAANDKTADGPVDLGVAQQKMQLTPRAMQAYQLMTHPRATEGDKVLAKKIFDQEMQPRMQTLTIDGRVLQVDPATNKATVLYDTNKEAEKPPEPSRIANDALTNWKKYNFPDPSDPKNAAWWQDFNTKRLGGQGGVTVNNNMGAQETYNDAISKSVGKRHEALMGSVEENASQARDLAFMEQAVNNIVKNGGTTGMGQETLLKLKSTANSLANTFGIDAPYDISDPEGLRKFGRQLAGAQAKAVGGARVTNFEFNNFLNANPGIETSPTGNIRMLGIARQIADRNVELGQSMRDYAAQQIADGKKVDPASMENLIKTYDKSHPVLDPVTKQDLTQKYALPDLQKDAAGKGGAGATAPAATAPPAKPTRRYDPQTGQFVDVAP